MGWNFCCRSISHCPMNSQTDELNNCFFCFHVTFLSLIRLKGIHMELEEFKITVLPLRDKLLNYARRMTDCAEDAEDAVQETLLRLWNRRGELEGCRSVEAFAMTVVRNLCMDLWRTDKENQTLDNLQIADAAVTPEQLLEQKDGQCLMDRIVGSLPPLQQTVMRMKDFEGYETEEIAAITGCSHEAVRSNLSRARRRVRDIYLKLMQSQGKEKRA